MKEHQILGQLLGGARFLHEDEPDRGRLRLQQRGDHGRAGGRAHSDVPGALIVAGRLVH